MSAYDGIMDAYEGISGTRNLRSEEQLKEALAHRPERVDELFQPVPLLFFQLISSLQTNPSTRSVEMKLGRIKGKGEEKVSDEKSFHFRRAEDNERSSRWNGETTDQIRPENGPSESANQFSKWWHDTVGAREWALNLRRRKASEREWVSLAHVSLFIMLRWARKWRGGLMMEIIMKWVRIWGASNERVGGAAEHMLLPHLGG